MQGNQREHKGLYDPLYEHDSCGIGFVANINGTKSRSIVSDAIIMLENMEHRGIIAANKRIHDVLRGDTVGISFSNPKSFIFSNYHPSNPLSSGGVGHF